MYQACCAPRRYGRLLSSKSLAGRRVSFRARVHLPPTVWVFLYDLQINSAAEVIYLSRILPTWTNGTPFLRYPSTTKQGERRLHDQYSTARRPASPDLGCCPTTSEELSMVGISSLICAGHAVLPLYQRELLQLYRRWRPQRGLRCAARYRHHAGSPRRRDQDRGISSTPVSCLQCGEKRAPE